MRLRHPVAGSALALLLLAAPPPASADEPIRNGFTLELGLGLGFTEVFPSVGGSISKVGLAPLSLSLGGFVNNRLAIMFRLQGTSYFQDVRGTLFTTVLAFYGVHV